MPKKIKSKAPRKVFEDQASFARTIHIENFDILGPVRRCEEIKVRAGGTWVSELRDQRPLASRLNWQTFQELTVAEWLKEKSLSCGVAANPLSNIRGQGEQRVAMQFSSPTEGRKQRRFR